MDILLTQLPSPVVSDFAENLGLAYLASHLRSYDYEVQIFDGYLEMMHLDDYIKAIIDKYYFHSFLILGITVCERNFENLQTCLPVFRSEGLSCHIILGGVLPTIVGKKLFQDLPWIDSICVGDGEKALYKLVKVIKHGEDFNDIPNLIFKEHNKPFKSSLIENENIFLHTKITGRDTQALLRSFGSPISILRSRGCWANCNYCTVHSLSKINEPYLRFQTRSNDSVLEELAILTQKYNCKKFRFIDDQFVGPGHVGRLKTLAFAKALIKSDMQISFWISTRSDTVDERLFQCLKEAGLDFVFLGIESWDNSTLERMNKNLSVRQNSIACSILSKLNIDFRVGFIMFDPFCRMEDVVTNINAIKNYLAMGYRLYSADSLYRKTRAFIGTELFETLNKNNLLFKISSYHYDYKFEIQETEDFYSNLNIWIAKTKETQRLINRINLLILHGSLPKRIQIIASKFVKRWLIFQISIFENILDHWMASKCIYSNAKYIHSLITKYRYSLFCFYKVALIYLFCSRFYLISLKDQQYKNKKNLGMQKNKVK